uniref:Uncharacterized protein n=1 Tax=Clandestinovirus TaxID=2831644 RepID=A0A8F8PN73_9VIRU|nr:hypothetical protein KOM_12_278 [Clandestinovirus]
MDPIAKHLHNLCVEEAWPVPPTTFPKQAELDALLAEKKAYEQDLSAKVREEFLKMLAEKYYCWDPKRVMDAWVAKVKPHIYSIYQGCPVSVVKIDKPDASAYDTPYHELFTRMGSHPGMSEENAAKFQPVGLEKLCLAYHGYEVNIAQKSVKVHWGN